MSLRLRKRLTSLWIVVVEYLNSIRRAQVALLDQRGCGPEICVLLYHDYIIDTSSTLQQESLQVHVFAVSGFVALVRLLNIAPWEAYHDPIEVSLSASSLLCCVM